MKYYKTWHGAKRGAIAMAKRSGFDWLIISTNRGDKFLLRPAKNPWAKGRLGFHVCARINAEGMTVI